MKLNELNKIEEGLVSGLKDMFSGQGKYQTQVQNIFIKDFVQDAIASLRNGLSGGLITKDTKPTPAQPEQPAATTPTTPTQPAAPGVQKMTPAQMTAAKSQNKIAPGTATGTGPTKRLTPRDRLMLQRQAKAVKESSYDKMNRVFESIINIDEADGQMSISEYLMTWFEKYMQGVSWEAKKPLVQSKLDKLQADYPTNLKTNLEDLARFALAASKTSIPAGAPPEFAQASKQGAAAGQASIQELKAALDDFAKTNPAGYNAFIKSLRPAQAS